MRRTDRAVVHVAATRAHVFFLSCDRRDRLRVWRVIDVSHSEFRADEAWRILNAARALLDSA